MTPDLATIARLTAERDALAEQVKQLQAINVAVRKNLSCPKGASILKYSLHAAAAIRDAEIERRKGGGAMAPEKRAREIVCGGRDPQTPYEAGAVRQYSSAIRAAIEEDRRRLVRCHVGHKSQANLWDCPHASHLEEAIRAEIARRKEGKA